MHCYRIRFLSEWDTQRQMLMDLIEKDEFWNNDNGSFCSFLAFVGTAIALWCHVLWRGDAVWLAVCLFVGFLCVGGYYSVLG